MTSFFDRVRQSDLRPAFLGNPIQRWSEARAALDLDAALKHPRATVYLFEGDRVLSRHNGAAGGAGFQLDAAQGMGLAEDSLVLLGIVGGVPRFAGTIGEGASLPANVVATDLRSLAIEGGLDQGELAALAQARSYLHWHAVNRFCGRCGGPLEMKGGGTSRTCPSCSTEIFPRVDPVVIMLAIDGDRCLLGRQARFAPGMYSALAGFLEPGETIEEAVRREVKEESGIAVGRVAYHSSQPWPFPHSLMIGCHAEALSTEVDRDAEELEDCRWFGREEVRAMLQGKHKDGLKAPFPMAIAHHLIRAFADS